MLSKNALLSGIKILKACFKSVNPDTETAQIWYRFLKDINDEDFLNAICLICKTKKQLYDNENVVAIINDKVAEMEQTAILETQKKEREQERLEWHELVKRHTNRTDEETQRVLAEVHAKLLDGNSKIRLLTRNERKAA